MSNTFTSRDTWEILKLSGDISQSPNSTPNRAIHCKKQKDRTFEKAFFVTHADIFDVFSDDAYDDIFDKVWEKAFLK